MSHWISDFQKRPQAVERRRGLKTTSKLIMAGVAMGLIFSSARVWASPGQWLRPSILAVAVGGQTEGQTKSAADNLLKAAQRAINEGKFELAESMISQAEKTGVRFRTFDVSHPGFTSQTTRSKRTTPRGKNQQVCNRWQLAAKIQ